MQSRFGAVAVACLVGVADFGCSGGSVPSTTGGGAGSGGGPIDGGSTDGGSGSGPGGSSDGGSSPGPGGSGSDGGSGSVGPATHLLTVDVSGTDNASGSVQSAPSGIACRPSCSASFADGTDVVLTATAASGSVFNAWKGASCSGSTCTVHLTADAQVTAQFQPSPTQDECAGLAPGDPGAPVRLQATDFGLTCDIATSDGSGNVAATITDILAAPPRDITSVRLFDRSGVSLGHFGYGSGPLFEQLAGFAGTSRPSQSNTTGVFAIDAHGNEIGSDSPGGFLGPAAEDPTGGLIVAEVDGQGNHLAAYDGAAHLRWRVALANGVRGGGGRVTLGVDRLGNTLVLTSEDAVPSFQGQWVDHDGHAGPPFTATADFGIDPISATLILAPRVGDGLFLEETSPRNAWLLQFDSLAAAALPPPSWLSSRPAVAVHMARGGHAYAFFESVSRSVSPCAQRIEIVAPSGKSCGTAVFPIGSASCSITGTIDVGYDGTVIQALPRELQRHNDDGTLTCTWQSWPGFLR